MSEFEDKVSIEECNLRLREAYRLLALSSRYDDEYLVAALRWVANNVILIGESMFSLDALIDAIGCDREKAEEIIEAFITKEEYEGVKARDGYVIWKKRYLLDLDMLEVTNHQKVTYQLYGIVSMPGSGYYEKREVISNLKFDKEKGHYVGGDSGAY